MSTAMLHYTFLFLTVGLCLGTLFFEWVGRLAGQRRLLKNPQHTLDGTSVIEGGIFAVWGLLLAFAFSGAATRLDTRRLLVGQEANTIGTAYLRLDILNPKDRDAIKSLFHDYLDLRIQMFQSADNLDLLENLKVKTAKMQNEIWTRSHKAAVTSVNSSAPILLLPSLNEMIDITTTRMVAIQTHPPPIVYIMILVVSFLCASIIGYDQAVAKSKSRLHIWGFVVINTLIFYVILDMEFPRLGFIRVDHIDQVLIQLKDTLK